MAGVFLVITGLIGTTVSLVTAGYGIAENSLAYFAAGLVGTLICVYMFKIGWDY